MKGKKLLSLVSLVAAGCSPAIANSPVSVLNVAKASDVQDLSYYDNNNHRENDKYLEQIIKSTEKVYHRVVYQLDYAFDDGSVASMEYPRTVSGSGIVLMKKGEYSYLLTNNHVIKRDKLEAEISIPESAVIIMISRKSERIFVKKDGKEVPLEVLANDSSIDAALLRAKGPGFDRFAGRIGNSDNLREGDFVYAIGNPLGEENYLTRGIISKVSPKRYDNWFMMQTPINPGNSGGPIIAIHKGKYHLVGLSVATKLLGHGVPAEGMKYGVKINPIMDMLKGYFKGNKE